MKELMKPVVVLSVICIVISALLGFTYDKTKPMIEATEKKASDAAMAEVVPGSTSFTELSADGVEGLLVAAKDDGGKGYAFKVQDKGFGGAYVAMVGISADGKVTGAKLMDNGETPGLGSKTGTPDFTGRFLDVDKAGVEGVETITGATISSKAFKRCVDTAFRAYETVGEGA